jgi:hypothetical protein
MEEQTETADVQYQVVKDAEIERFFAYDLEVDEEGFYYDDDGNLLGAVVAFDEYPTHETLTSIFDTLLCKGVMVTQEVDEADAQKMLEGVEDEEEFEEELDISESFSLFFTVEGHPGLYRMLLDCNDHWVGHSTGRRNDRWDI